MKRLLLLAALVPSFSYSMDFTKIISDEVAGGGANFRTAFAAFSEASAETAANTPGFVDPFSAATEVSSSGTPWGTIFKAGMFSWGIYSAYQSKVKTDKANQEADEKVAKTKADCEVEVQRINLENALEKRRLLAEAAEERRRISEETDRFRQEQLSKITIMAQQHSKDELTLLKMLLESEKSSPAIHHEEEIVEETKAEPEEQIESPVIQQLRTTGLYMPHKSSIHFN